MKNNFSNKKSTHFIFFSHFCEYMLHRDFKEAFGHQILRVARPFTFYKAPFISLQEVTATMLQYSKDGGFDPYNKDKL